MPRRLVLLLRKGVSPPSGFTPIPGGYHGGYHRPLPNGRWAYWYPGVAGTRTSPHGYAPHPRIPGVHVRDPRHPAGAGGAFWHARQAPRDVAADEAAALASPADTPTPRPARLPQAMPHPDALLQAMRDGATVIEMEGPGETWAIHPPPTGWPDAAALDAALHRDVSYAIWHARRRQNDEIRRAAGNAKALNEVRDARHWQALCAEEWKRSWGEPGNPLLELGLSFAVEARRPVAAPQPRGATPGAGSRPGDAAPPRPPVRATAGQQLGLFKGRRRCLLLLRKASRPAPQAFGGLVEVLGGLPTLQRWGFGPADAEHGAMWDPESGDRSVYFLTRQGIHKLRPAHLDQLVLHAGHLAMAHPSLRKGEQLGLFGLGAPAASPPAARPAPRPLAAPPAPSTASGEPHPGETFGAPVPGEGGLQRVHVHAYERHAPGGAVVHVPEHDAWRKRAADVSAPADARPNSSTRLPLEEYDHILVAFSGGKDSIAALIRLLEEMDEKGIPRSKVELWHHNVDGEPGTEAFVDWPVTEDYCRKFAAALGLQIRFQWRKGGFKGEILKENARSQAIAFETDDGIKEAGGKNGEIETRRMFPQATANLRVRWCSSLLKIDVCGAAISGDPRFRGTKDNPKKILLVSGERREESANRQRYAEVEEHRSSCQTRRVDQWRAVLGWNEAKVWDALRRWGLRPHPVYEVGYGRASCATCIFAGSTEWATLQALAPHMVEEIAQHEDDFGKTINREPNPAHAEWRRKRRGVPEWLAWRKGFLDWSKQQPADANTEEHYPVPAPDVTPTIGAEPETFLRVSVRQKAAAGVPLLQADEIAAAAPLVIQRVYEGPILVDPETWTLPKGAFRKTKGPS